MKKQKLLPGQEESTSSHGLTSANGKTLPKSIELSVLSFLDPDGWLELYSLSRENKTLVQAYLQRSCFHIQLQASRTTTFSRQRAVMRLIQRFATSLRTILVSSQMGCFNWSDRESALFSQWLRSVVRNNRGSLRKLEWSHTELERYDQDVLDVLSQCPHLQSFSTARNAIGMQTKLLTIAQNCKRLQHVSVPGSKESVVAEFLKTGVPLARFIGFFFGLHVLFVS